MKTFWLLLFLSCCCFACSYNNTFEKVVTDNRFSLEVPDYIHQEAGLNPEASLEYANKFRNIYMVVLEKPRQNMDIETYINTTKEDLVNRLNNPRLIDSTYTKINGLPAYNLKLEGDVGRGGIAERIFYNITFYEGKNRSYQFCMWTWESWREKYQADMTHIISSFKELDEAEG